MSHKITRRDLLKIGAVGAASAVLAGCEKPRRWVELEPYVRPPEQQLAGVATWYASTCRQCPAGCGIVARIMNGRALKLEGNPEHPLNQGKLCARGQAGLQVLYNPDRLSGPALGLALERVLRAWFILRPPESSGRRGLEASRPRIQAGSRV